MFLLSLLGAVPDTTLPKGSENFWYFSSCCAVAGMETLGFYAAAGLGGFSPLVVGVGSGSLGCIAYSNVARQLTPVPELRPKAARKAFNGGVLGIFVGGAVIILSSYVAGR